MFLPVGAVREGWLISATRSRICYCCKRCSTSVDYRSAVSLQRIASKAAELPRRWPQHLLTSFLPLCDTAARMPAPSGARCGQSVWRTTLRRNPTLQPTSMFVIVGHVAIIGLESAQSSQTR
jgi:hypothetical protein